MADAFKPGGVYDVRRRLLHEIGRAGLIVARRAIRSRTLRDSLVFQEITTTKGRLYIPQYWAIYQHDGRGGVLPVRKRYLVWFVDPKDDPRLSNGYPVRVSDIRRLTKIEFDEGRRRNEEMEAANPTGGSMQFMIVVDASFPTRPDKSYPFFEKGMADFMPLVDGVANRFIRVEAQRLFIRERDSVTLRV